jgi:hypothetical protein
MLTMRKAKSSFWLEQNKPQGEQSHSNTLTDRSLLGEQLRCMVATKTLSYLPTSC